MKIECVSVEFIDAVEGRTDLKYSYIQAGQKRYATEVVQPAIQNTLHNRDRLIAKFIQLKRAEQESRHEQPSPRQHRRPSRLQFGRCRT